MLLIILHAPIARSPPGKWETYILFSPLMPTAWYCAVILIRHIYEQCSDVSPILLKHATAPESCERFKIGQYTSTA